MTEKPEEKIKEPTKEEVIEKVTDLLATSSPDDPDYSPITSDEMLAKEASEELGVKISADFINSSLKDCDLFKGKKYSHHMGWKLTKKGEEKASKIKKTGAELQKRLRAKYIFDSNQILREKTFPQCKINDNSFAYGIFLVKEQDIIVKGEIMGTEQVAFPVLITSEKLMIECVPRCIEKEWKIRVKPPYNLPVAWSPESIEQYLVGNVKSIDGKKLFKNIREQYEKFLYFRDDEWYDIHALWDMGTYFFMLFNHYPILEMRGIRGAAKTKTMKVSNRIALNALEIMVNPSEATLFRETEEKRPTKYIDEAEKLFVFNTKTKQVESDLRAELINSSYSKGSVVPRQEKIKERFVTVGYHTYSPTMIGSINGLYGATEERAITHIMTRAPDNDNRGEMEPENYENDPVWQKLRDSLYIYGLQKWKQIEQSYLNFKNDTKIKKRDLQIWKPLLVMAETIDKKLYEKIKKFAEEISEQRRNDTIPEGTLDNVILRGIAQLIREGNRLIYLKALRDMIKEKLENPPREKTISNRIVNLGFDKRQRGKDWKGAFFEIPENIFVDTVSPICPDAISIITETPSYSSDSSDSSDLNLKKFNKKKKAPDEYDEKIKTVPDEYDENDESDALTRKEGIFVKLRKLRDSPGGGPKHLDFLKSFCSLSDDEINQAKTNGLIQEVTPGMWEIV